MVHFARVLEEFFCDLRYAYRQLRRTPIVSVVCVATLALGIGANAAIFSVVEAVLLRPLPFKNANRLVDLTEYRPGGVDQGGVPYPDYLVWKQQNTVFEETAAYYLINASNDIVLGGPFSTERERYSIVTNSFFTILGVQPALGRGFSAANETPGGEKVFLVSNAVWRGVFGADARALYKTYLLDGEEYTLIGVMPPGFDFPKGCGIWLPTGTLRESGLRDRVSHPYHVLGRLRTGVEPPQAEAQVETLQQGLAKAYPATDTDWHVRARPLRSEVIGNVQTSLLVLLGAVGFILLIACTNVMNLMLARASAREKEFAIRSALGAGRGRLVRQNLTEGFLVVWIGSAVAVVFAKWGLALTVSLTSVRLPRMEAFHLSWPVLVFLAVIAALVTALIGLTPAAQAWPHDPEAALRDGQRGGSGRQSQRLRSALIVSEVALALLLLCGAGLMLRSFVQLLRVNPGFQTERLLTMKIALPGGAYSKLEQTSAYLERLLISLRGLPGVQSVAAASTLPLTGESDWDTFQIAGSATPDWSRDFASNWRGVSLDYFQTLRIPLLRGRDFRPDDAKTQGAVIINSAMAKKFWPGTDPLGRSIFIGHQERPRQIVGIVGDVKAGLNAEARPEAYTLMRGFWYTFLALRTTGEPSSTASLVREEVAALDKGVPVYQVATMDQLLSSSVATQRFDLFLLVLFAALALGLAAVGVYGVLTFSVSRRTREIGIRMALGAHRSNVLSLILTDGMKLVFAGTATGLAGAAALTRLMRGLLYGVSVTDPVTFLGAALLLAAVALLACYIPARRATHVDPILALRSE
ncbi:MAG TPA: ABC transporter permease [Candidatus Acidoferrum sp.]|nr:ABC transporter permease [Candidatus Acidoferrum sp.]